MSSTWSTVGARARLGAPWEIEPPAAWRGFSGAQAVVVERWIIDRDDFYVHARTADQEEAAWYHQASLPEYQPGLIETPMPMFSDDTMGFRRVDDDAAAARGLQRWTADVAGVDLAFLGYFAPTYGNVNYAPGEATIDVWVDDAGRVRRTEVVSVEVPTVVRFGRFDDLAPIPEPSAADGALPVATVAGGLTITVCGDPAAAETMRRRLEEALAADGDIAVYRFLGKPTPEQDRIDDTQMDPDDRLFIVAVRLRDDVDVQRKMNRGVDRLLNVTTHDPTADVCSVGSANWLELGG